MKNKIKKGAKYNANIKANPMRPCNNGITPPRHEILVFVPILF